METKFTKGPWNVHNNQSVLTADNNEFVCLTNGLSTNMSANAHLIANCPVMFEYINKKANEGCEDAKSIIQSIWPS